MLAAPVAPVRDPAPAITPAAAERTSPRYPALWVINDSDTVIYLFGTFHALDGRSDWFGQAVKTAFSESDQLILETLVPKPDAVPPLPPGDYSLRPRQSIPVSQLGPSSYLDDNKAVVDAGRKRGLSTALGADAVLRNVAEATGKPVGELESFDFQIRMFSSVPPAPQPARMDPRAVDATGAFLSRLQAAWTRGDLDSFEPMLLTMRAQAPQMYRTVFVERNSRWAQWIAQRLQTPGTVFVAVGAGHLSGPDSVQQQLAWLGVKSARVN